MDSHGNPQKRVGAVDKGSYPPLEKRTRVNRGGTDTFGNPIVSHIDAIEDEYAAFMKQISDVKDFLLAGNLHGQASDWKQKHFAVLSITPYCKVTHRQLIPAEFAIVVFSFEGGIKEIHSGFINPGEIPFGELGEVQQQCDINGLPFPGNTKATFLTPSNFNEIVFNLTNKYGLFMDNKYLFFAPRFHLPIMNCCLAWIYAQKELEKSPKMFTILHLEVLLMEMSKLVDDPENTRGVIRHEGGAGKFIFHPRYDFVSEIACDWHQKGDAVNKVDRCCQNIALRHAYNALFYLCHLFKREITPVTHSPYAPPAPQAPAPRRR